MSNANFFFDEQQQVFHLSNQQVSNFIQIEDGGVLSHLYFGKKVSGYHGSRLYQRLDRGFSPNLAGEPHQTDRRFSKDTLLQLMSIGLYNAPIEQADFTSSVRYFRVQENELK